MKLIKEKLEIEYLKSLTYTEINEIMNMLNAEINQLKYQAQLLQSRVVESVCKHCANKLCDSQAFNQQCFKCGKKPL